jgi:putative restriction endonuclease
MRAQKEDVNTLMREFFDKFEEYCKTPGVDSGKARSYAKAIEYLCDYLKITEIDLQSVALIKGSETDIYNKNSPFYQSLLLFLIGRGQRSYLENGYIKASLKYFFAFFQYINSENRRWTKDETVLALALYCKIPFGKIHKGHPQVIELAKLLGRTPAAVSMKMGNFGRFDDALAAKGITGLAHGSTLDKAVWDEYHLNMQALSETVEQIPYMEDLLDDDDMSAPLPVGTTRTTTVRARVNQRFFRSAVLTAYNQKCCVTGLDVPALLIASHIKPWKDSDPATERTNPCNGFALNALHHDAFDNGIFTIDTDYRILVSKAAKDRYTSDVFHDFFGKHEGKTIILPERFLPSKDMIEYHNSRLKDF